MRSTITDTNEEWGKPETTSTGINWWTPLKSGSIDGWMDQCPSVRLKMCSAAAAWQEHSAQGTDICKPKEKRHRLLLHPVTVYKSRNSQQRGVVTSVYTCSYSGSGREKLGTTRVLINKDEEMKIYCGLFIREPYTKVKKVWVLWAGDAAFPNVLGPGFRLLTQKK